MFKAITIIVSVCWELLPLMQIVTLKESCTLPTVLDTKIMWY